MAIGTPFRYMIVSGFLEFVSVTLVAILAQALGQLELRDAFKSVYYQTSAG